jgi:hypothetical protein
MDIKEYRHFIRHPVCWPLSYTVIKPAKAIKETKETKEKKSQTINVSLGGLLFPGKKAVEPEEKVLIKMPFENKIFNVKAKVVRCVKNLDTNCYDIAVSFSRPQEAFKVKMIEQIYLISEYRDLLILQSGKEISLEEASRKWIKRYSERFRRLYW